MTAKRDDALDTARPQRVPKLLAYACLGLITLLYVAPITWDLFFWMIYGGHAMLSSRFKHMEGLFGPAFAYPTLMIGFLGVDRGLELIKRGRVVAFCVALFTVIGAGIPVAPFLFLLNRTLALKGSIVITHPRFIMFAALAALLFACKCRAITQYFHLMRPDLARLLTRDARRFTVVSAEDRL